MDFAHLNWTVNDDFAPGFLKIKLKAKSESHNKAKKQQGKTVKKPKRRKLKEGNFIGVLEKPHGEETN